MVRLLVIGGDTSPVRQFSRVGAKPWAQPLDSINAPACLAIGKGHDRVRAVGSLDSSRNPH